MPETYVVHLGNSKELMEVAEDSIARRVLQEHIRESLGVRKDDLLLAIINSMLFNQSSLSLSLIIFSAICLYTFSRKIGYKQYILYFVQ